MAISAQWELVLGNSPLAARLVGIPLTQSYTQSFQPSAGFFYGGFGAIVTPLFGVSEEADGTGTADYSNALGFFVLMWAVLNLFFLLGSLAIYVHPHIPLA